MESWACEKDVYRLQKKEKKKPLSTLLFLSSSGFVDSDIIVFLRVSSDVLLMNWTPKSSQRQTVWKAGGISTVADKVFKCPFYHKAF